MICAGHPFVKTPNLDRLASEGTRFATAYTVAPICTPSRYSFFTGRYAHVHGSTDNNTPLREPQLHAAGCRAGCRVVRLRLLRARRQQGPHRPV